MRVGTMCLSGVIVSVWSAAALAQPVPLAPVIGHNGDGSAIPITHEQGYEFVTINPAGIVPSPDVWTGISPSGGAADHAFRISRTETTNGQWLDFITSYSHWFPVDTIFNPTAQLGLQIHGTGNPNQPFAMSNASQLNAPVVCTWRMAAVYCNWLCHDRADNAQAFLTGAYNVSTFGYQTLPGGITMMTDQLTHSPGAQYWIPTFEEMTTAMHWDANRYGAGQGGWWQRSTTSDTLVPYHIAHDQEGYDIVWSDYSNIHVPGTLMDAVGQYGVIQSPWGLLDTVGGVAEYTEAVSRSPDTLLPSGRYWLGTSWRFIGTDALDAVLDGGPNDINWLGLRIAAAIPTPPTFLLVGCAGVQALRRKRSRSITSGRSCQ